MDKHTEKDLKQFKRHVLEYFLLPHVQKKKKAFISITCFINDICLLQILRGSSLINNKEFILRNFKFSDLAKSICNILNLRILQLEDIALMFRIQCKNKVCETSNKAQITTLWTLVEAYT